MSASQPASIDEYLRGVTPQQKRLLEELRTRIRTILPQAQECISYRIPAFRLDGTVVAGFAATAGGGSYYPFSGTTLKTLARELRSFSQTKSALHFSAEHPLSAALVRKLLRARITETRAAQSSGRSSRRLSTDGTK